MVPRIAVVTLASLLTTASHGAALASDRPIAWTELPDPTTQVYEDPFLELSIDQLSDLATVVRLRERLGSDAVSDQARPRLEARLSETEATLTDEGVDIEDMLAQRELVIERRTEAALSPNPDLDGSAVALSGFLVPAPDAPDGTAIAYLVPEFGMCSHYPPPPPNQLIRLRLPDDVLEAGLHFAATVRGELNALETDQQIYVVDGPVRMWSSWTMEVDAVDEWNGLEPW